MEKTKSIQIFKGVNIETDDGIIFCESPTDIWKLFRWDIENDLEQKECASVIIRELLCFGIFDISVACGFKKCILRVVPCDKE